MQEPKGHKEKVNSSWWPILPRHLSWSVGNLSATTSWEDQLAWRIYNNTFYHAIQSSLHGRGSHTTNKIHWRISYWDSVHDQKHTYKLYGACWIILLAPISKFWSNCVFCYHRYTQVSPIFNFLLILMLEIWKRNIQLFLWLNQFKFECVNPHGSFIL